VSVAFVRSSVDVMADLSSRRFKVPAADRLIIRIAPKMHWDSWHLEYIRVHFGRETVLDDN
jgi:hypothetical protein